MKYLKNHLKIKRLPIPESEFTTLRTSNETTPCRGPLYPKNCNIRLNQVEGKSQLYHLRKTYIAIVLTHTNLNNFTIKATYKSYHFLFRGLQIIIAKYIRKAAQRVKSYHKMQPNLQPNLCSMIASPTTKKKITII